MHLQQIHENYPQAAVEVAFVVSGASESVRKSGFPQFREYLKVSYTALDDRYNRVVPLYGLNPSSKIAKNLIIDRKGKVCLAGEFTPLADMTEKLDALLGKGEKLDLSTPERALKSLDARESYVRWKAAQALGKMGDRAAVGALLRALSDESECVRECAAGALGKLGDRKAVAALLAGLKDESIPVRIACIKALGELGDGAAVEPLMQALSQESNRVKEHAAGALGKLGDRKACDSLLATLKDRSPFVRLAVLKALGPLKDERAIVPLVKLMSDTTYLSPAAQALAEIHRPDLVAKALKEHLPGLLKSDSPMAAYVYLQLGMGYARNKAFDEGIANLKKAMELQPSLSSTVHLQLGDIYRERGMLDRALAEYDKHLAPILEEIEKGTAEAFVYNNLSWFYVEKKIRPGESLSLAKKAIELEPDSPVILDTLGWAYLRAGDFDRAIETFIRVFSVQPDFDSSWEGISELVQLKMGREQFLNFCGKMAGLAARDARVKTRLRVVQAEFDKLNGPGVKRKKGLVEL